MTFAILESDIFKSLSAKADLSQVSGAICFDEFEECEKHGRYQTMVDVDGCPIKSYSINQMCPQCKRERIAKDIIGKAGIQKRFLDCNFDNYVVSGDKQQAVKDRLMVFANNFSKVLELGSSLVLSGGVGTGKTHLSCAIANSIAEKGYTSCFVTVSEIIRAVREASNWSRSGGKSAQQIIDDYTAFDLLIIDEFGVQSDTDSERNIIFDVINNRYAEQKPTMALTNLTSEDFKKLVGDRAYDRLTHKGTALTLNWESYRSKGRKS